MSARSPHEQAGRSARRSASASAPVDEAFSLAAGQLRQLRSRLERALERARRSGQPTLASSMVALPCEVDPCAVVCASRRPGEPWFAFEQPERGRRALGALGEVARLRASGEGRFAEVAERWRALAAPAIDDEAGADRCAPLAVGGFAFAPNGGGSPRWSGFEPASLTVPEVAITRDRDAEGRLRVRLRMSALLAADDTVQEALSRLQRRLGELTRDELPLLDPAPTGRAQVVSAMPPEHYEAAVARATELIDAGAIEKIVLAREVQVHASTPYDPAAIFGVLRDQFPSCFCFCVGRGQATFVAASPELLVRREGQRVSTLALAGSTRRSADPSVDAHLGEQLLRSEAHREEHAIVVRRIQRTLRAHAVWVAAAPEPVLVRIANIQHLATPIRAQLATAMDTLALAGRLHPTPAVGGEPLRGTYGQIPALEGLDRGWYAGPVGWTDATGDGELCVALRCALLRGAVARCYAGNGIVRGSDPAAELAETEVKLQALLPLLAG
jgi:menaquinone-specific isochorismate synthase